MSQTPQDFDRKKVKKSKSQGWSLPHLVTLQSKKTAAASLHTPDEQEEISPMTKEEISLHQSSPPRSPGSPASNAPGSVASSHQAVVTDDQSIQHAESEIEQNAEENAELTGDDSPHDNEASLQHISAETPSQRAESGIEQNAQGNAQLAEGSSQHDNEASLQHVEAESPSQHTEEENVQHAKDGNTLATGPEEVIEILDRSPREPCTESNCNHGEESSTTSSDASADVEAEEHAARHETTKHTPESAKYAIEQPSAAHSTVDESSRVSAESPKHIVESRYASLEANPSITPEFIPIGEELSRIESPVIVRDFGTTPLKDDTVSLKKFPTLPPPRIVIQRASNATDFSNPYPSPPALDWDKQLHEPSPSEESDRSSGGPQGADSMASRTAIIPELTSNISHDIEDPEKPKVKRRKLVVRKARNLVMRKHFLQLFLGKELAEHAKPALRLLAQGEPVPVNLAVAGERDPMLHMSESSTLDLSRYGH